MKLKIIYIFTFFFPFFVSRYALMTVEMKNAKLKQFPLYVPTVTFLAGKIQARDASWFDTALREFEEETAGLISTHLPQLWSEIKDLN